MLPLVRKSIKFARFFNEKPLVFSLENAEKLNNYSINLENSIKEAILKEEKTKNLVILLKNLRRNRILSLFSAENKRKILQSLSISLKTLLSYRRIEDFSLLLKSKALYIFPKENPSFLSLSLADKENFIEIIKEKPLEKRMFYYSRLFKSPEIQIKKIFSILPEDLSILKENKQIFLKNIKISLVFLQENELTSLIKSLNLEDLKKIKRKKLVYLLVFISKHTKTTNFDEFFFNLSLLSRPILNIKTLVYIEKKLKNLVGPFQEFFKKELQFLVEKITSKLIKAKALAICDKKLMRNIKKISCFLTNEYYVFKFYKDFLAVLRNLMLYRGDINKKMSFKTCFYRISICKSLNIRLNIKIYEDILNVLSGDSMKLDYFLVKTQGKIIDLLVEKEEVRAEILQKIIETTLKLSNFSDVLGIRSQIKACEIDLLVYTVILHKVCFISDHWILLIKQLFQNLLETKNLPFTQFELRGLKYIFFNSLILLKNKKQTEKNKNHEELLEFLEKWNKSLLFPINISSELQAKSRPEKELLVFLRKEQSVVKTNYFIGCFCVDFYLPNTKTIIEYQGLQHFFLEIEKKKKDMMPKDILKKEILMKMGYKFLFVSCWEWKRLRNDQDKLFFIQNLLGNKRKFAQLTNEAQFRKIKRMEN